MIKLTTPDAVQEFFDRITAFRAWFAAHPHLCNTVQNVCLNIIFACTFAVIWLLAYWRWWPIEPMFNHSFAQIIEPRLHAYETVKLLRTFTANYEGEATIYTEIRSVGQCNIEVHKRTIEGLCIHRVDSQTAYFKKGTSTILFTAILPDMPPGEYQVSAYAKVPLNPLRTVRELAPTAYFEVVK